MSLFRYISPKDMSGNYDLDAEYAQGLRDHAAGEYNPPSRDPVTAVSDGIFGQNEEFEAAQRAYEAGVNSDDFDNG